MLSSLLQSHHCPYAQNMASGRLVFVLHFVLVLQCTLPQPANLVNCLVSFLGPPPHLGTRLQTAAANCYLVLTRLSALALW